ncbi:MAG: SPOR domain-containing protein [Gammaproteobacteria bacterium]|nr:SPOR domain-containing protein [Gammaproteobacteria bacterium]NNF50533.1 SPOR domain-containing protein [Woeseiaceae bacterium]MBT8094340.1 SPOR domain-containing protein [Gammaproteobacteria bacterium]MBT8104413.1 SPOR domain-containing protein [Gammaproteobacteria bacterium]NNK24429.1 SPOR domain-containing protein [Woeseiaceae bacterium]
MAKRRRRSTKKSGVSPVVAMLFGLAVGLSVAVAVYVKDRRDPPVGAGVGVEGPSTPASLQSALDDNGETSTVSSAGGPPDPKEEKEVRRFTFYDILPNFEVVTPDEEPAMTAGAAPQVVVEPGLYVLQAGSFSSHNDADRRRAELALRGIESHIQRVKVNDRDYHRVYVGPTDDLDELNMLRSRLRAAQIDVLRIRLGD